MTLPAPKWHALLEGNILTDTTAARQNFSSNVSYVEQNGGRILLTTYARPRAALVSLQDIALLQILDQNPELLARVKAHLPS